jgi:hypothetical protein
VERAAARRIRWKQSGDGLEAPWRAFAGADAVLRVAAVYAALDRLGASRVPYRFLEPLRRPLDAEKGGILVAGCGYRIERRGDRVRAEPDVVRRRKIGYLVHVRAPGEYAIPEWGIVVEASSSDPGVFRAGVSDGDALVVRSARCGDRVRRRDTWVGIDRLAAGCRGGRGAAALLPIVANRSGVLRVLGSAVGCAEPPEDRTWVRIPGWPVISVAVRVEEQ